MIKKLIYVLSFLLLFSFNVYAGDVIIDYEIDEKFIEECFADATAPTGQKCHWHYTAVIYFHGITVEQVAKLGFKAHPEVAKSGTYPLTVTDRVPFWNDYESVLFLAAEDVNDLAEVYRAVFVNDNHARNYLIIPKELAEEGILVTEFRTLPSGAKVDVNQ